MKIIKILGTGCKKCETLTNIVKEVVAEKKIDAQIEKVEDLAEIMRYHVMATPALVIDNVVMIKGKVPSKSEVEKLFEQKE